MNNWRFIGGRFKRDSDRQWAPTLTAHDPTPPLSLENLSSTTGTGAATAKHQSGAASGSLVFLAELAGVAEAGSSAAVAAEVFAATQAASAKAGESNGEGLVELEGTTGEGTATAKAATGDATGLGLIPINQLGVIIGDKVLANLPLIPRPPAKSTVAAGSGIARSAISSAAGVTKKYMNSAVGGAVAAKAAVRGEAVFDYESQNEEELAVLL